MSYDIEPSGRVVVTGIGLITPLGVGTDSTWDGIRNGKSGAVPITHFDVSDYPTRIAAQVPDFDASEFLEPKEARRIDRFLALAEAATQMALTSSGFDESDAELGLRTGVLIGSGIGGLTFLGEQTRKLFSAGPSRVSPYLVPYMIPDMASGYVSIQHGFKGPNSCVVTACSTGANAIGDAYHVIKRGDAVAMVAGGSEAPINEIGMAGFCSMRAMTTRNDEPESASRPFDATRDGFVIAEGCGVVMLEDYEFAKNRGANIVAEVVGYGMSGDAHHITAPDPEGSGAVRCMQAAIRQAKIKPEQIGYINAHGTSTPMNDRIETAAIKQALGEDVARKTPVSSTKSMTGHTLGAAGAIETIICILAMQHGFAPPTINYQNPDPDCDLDYVPNAGRDCDIEYALSNSFGFGGHNVSLILKRP